MKILFVFTITLIATLNLGFGQGQPNLGQTSTLMHQAIAAMEAKDFNKANQYFREIIDRNITIPPEMPYYFAETLFELKQYDNASNFLNKYLELNGFKGDNHENAKDLEERLKQPLEEIRACQLCDRRGYRFKTCFTCEGSKVTEQDCHYCRGIGIVGCSRCAGSGLITRKNIFNIVEYFQCERCSGNGRLVCPTCKGSKSEVSACKTCKGSGQLNSENICNHQEVATLSFNLVKGLHDH